MQMRVLPDVADVCLFAVTRHELRVGTNEIPWVTILGRNAGFAVGLNVAHVLGPTPSHLTVEPAIACASSLPYKVQWSCEGSVTFEGVATTGREGLQRD